MFESNDEGPWAQIRVAAGGFMHNLFRRGAFQGSSPRDAYPVKCDGETTTQNDIDLGIVNVMWGFAPLKPAEFVILKSQQIADQVQTFVAAAADTASQSVSFWITGAGVGFSILLVAGLVEAYRSKKGHLMLRLDRLMEGRE